MGSQHDHRVEVARNRCTKVSPIESLLQYRFATPNPLKARPGPGCCETAPLCKLGCREASARRYIQLSGAPSKVNRLVGKGFTPTSTAVVKIMVGSTQRKSAAKTEASLFLLVVVLVGHVTEVVLHKLLNSIGVIGMNKAVVLLWRVASCSCMRVSKGHRLQLSMARELERTGRTRKYTGCYLSAVL